MAPRWWSVSEEGRRHLGGGRAMAPWTVVVSIVRKGNGISGDDCLSEEATGQRSCSCS